MDKILVHLFITFRIIKMSINLFELVLYHSVKIHLRNSNKRLKNAILVDIRSNKGIWATQQNGNCKDGVQIRKH